MPGIRKQVPRYDDCTEVEIGFDAVDVLVTGK